MYIVNEEFRPGFWSYGTLPFWGEVGWLRLEVDGRCRGNQGCRRRATEQGRPKGGAVGGGSRIPLINIPALQI